VEAVTGAAKAVAGASGKLLPVPQFDDPSAAFSRKRCMPCSVTG